MLPDRMSQLRCQLIPLSNTEMVLPNTAVAEVIDYQKATAVESAPGWLRGTIAWRGLNIPLVSLEAAIAGKSIAAGSTQGFRIVVLNGIAGNTDLPFYAIESRGIPHLVSLGEGNIFDADDDVPTSKFCLRYVTINSGRALIPNLDAVEEALRGARQKVVAVVAS
jgi:chemosensory pili system protein ChpC